jgi:hypothetical protein
MKAFTFDSPVVTSINYGASNAPASGGSSVTMMGMNFGNHDFSPTGRVGPSLCATTSWTSASHIRCQSISKSAATTDSGLKVDLYTLIGTLMATFTYDSPVISHHGVLNIPTERSAMVSIDGINFGSSGLSQTARIGSSMCLSDVWVSDTQVHCLSPFGYGILRTTAITVNQLLGTRMQAFTFDAAVPTSIEPGNQATTDSGFVTVGGLNFGPTDLTTTARIGSTPCGTTLWTSGTAISCAVASGLGYARSFETTISVTVGTLHSAFSYDSPVISETRTPNGPTSGSTSLTIDGTSFGQVNPTATLHIGSSVCGTASWQSASSVLCHQKSIGYKGGFTATVTLSRLVGTPYKVFSFDAPAITQIYTANIYRLALAILSH